MPGKSSTRQSLANARDSLSIKIQLIAFAGLFIFRNINAQFVQTFFQPDEFFQSLEPAWQWAFGPNSGAWITWEWKEHLRSSLHPLLFSTAYRTADQLTHLFQVDSFFRTKVLLATPRIVQTLFAAVMDLFTWRLATKIYGSKNPASLATLALTVSSPWQWFCSVRTFSNSLETTLTIIALDFFPWTRFMGANKIKRIDGSSTGLSLSLTAAAIACVLRPTNIIVWATISACLVLRFWNPTKAAELVGSAVMYGTAVLAVTSSIDRAFYGEWTFPPLRFLHFNVVQSLAIFYGSNRLDYYFTEGVPLLLMTALPFGLVGLWQSLRPSHQQKLRSGELVCIKFVLAMAVVTCVLALSAISHKEVRFLYPLLPILHILAARPIAEFFHPFPIPRKIWKRAVLILILILNACISWYFGVVHQRGVMDAVRYIRHRQESWIATTSHPNFPLMANPNITAAFLMPCHSTAWRSEFVYPEIDAWALTCEPPLHMSLGERQGYLDEADVFYENPMDWIDQNMEDRKVISENTDWEMERTTEKRRWPDYLVFFEQLQSTMETILNGTRYRECKRFFNTHWHDDRRRQGDVVVWCMRKWGPWPGKEQSETVQMR